MSFLALRVRLPAHGATRHADGAFGGRDAEIVVFVANAEQIRVGAGQLGAEALILGVGVGS